MTKLLVLGLSLTFAASQAVAWADCCCGPFCAHKNACTGCGPEDGCPGGPERASCCEDQENGPDTACSHQEPSSEIDGTSSPAPDVAPDLAAPILPALALPAPPASVTVRRPATGPPRAGPLPSPRPVLLI